MKINEVIQPINEDDRPLTQSELDQIEAFADKVFSKVGIDVNFTRHFIDRVNDSRNNKQITASELTRLFKQSYKKWGKRIAQLGPDAQAVLVDLNTDVNMPFALDWDEQNQELDLYAKTIMRKPDFKTSNQKFTVEDSEQIDEVLPAIAIGAAHVARMAAPHMARAVAKYAPRVLNFAKNQVNKFMNKSKMGKAAAAADVADVASSFGGNDASSISNTASAAARAFTKSS